MRLTALFMTGLALFNANCTRSQQSAATHPAPHSEKLVESTHHQVEDLSPTDVASITLDRILDGRKKILYVTHDADDGSWQFLDGDPVTEEDARVVGLSQIIKLDSTLKQLADLPRGWYATREAVGRPWRLSAKETD